MQKVSCLVLACAFLTGAEASWFWPFGGSEKDSPRLSELVRTASEIIGEASELASDGKTSEAVARYREALVELDRVEREHPELGEKVAGGTLKTKRAYVEAAIDSLLMNEARANAKPVAVSDTAELERRLAAEREARPAAKRAPRAAARAARPARALTPREEAMKAIGEGDYAKAGRLVAALLDAKPNDAAALNLRAAKEAAEGDFRAAEKTLDTAIASNPRDHFAFYNMAMLKLQTRSDDRDGARRYYETGRALGGPRDEEIEEMLK